MSHVLFVHVAQVLKDGPDSRELVLLQDGMATMEMAGRTVRTETRGMLKAGGGSMRQVKGTSDETLVIWGCRTLSQLVDNLFIFMKGTILINLHFPLFQCCGRTDFSHVTIFMCLVATAGGGFSTCKFARKGRMSRDPSHSQRCNWGNWFISEEIV